MSAVPLPYRSVKASVKLIIFFVAVLLSLAVYMVGRTRRMCRYFNTVCSEFFSCNALCFLVYVSYPINYVLPYGAVQPLCISALVFYTQSAAAQNFYILSYGFVIVRNACCHSGYCIVQSVLIKVC